MLVSKPQCYSAPFDKSSHTVMDVMYSAITAFVLLNISGVFCSELELVNYLFDSTKYSPNVRPRKDPRQILEVQVELDIHFISSLDEIGQVLYTGGFLVAEWQDDFLKWNSSEYNITNFIVPPDKLWLPDFAIVNSAGEVYKSLYTSHFRPQVDSNGSVIWMFGGNFATTCQLILTYFPFDEQKCGFTIENWAYPASQVDLINKTKTIIKDDYMENGEWSFAHSDVIKEYIHHDIYKNDKFPKVTFNFYLKRKAGYYMLNIVTPCCMIIALALFVFWLPADSGEKVSLGITVLLGFSVFQLVIADNVPKTSDFTPLLSKYVAFIMGISCVSTILAIFILYLHFKATSRRPHRILRLVFFNFFARVFCMTIPDRVRFPSSPKSTDVDPSEKDPSGISVDGFMNEIKMEKISEDVGMEKAPRETPVFPEGATHLLSDIASHVRYLTMLKKDKEAGEEISEEWKTLARVIDRGCFFLSLIVITAVCSDLFIGSAAQNTYNDGH